MMLAWSLIAAVFFLYVAWISRSKMPQVIYAVGFLTVATLVFNHLRLIPYPNQRPLDLSLYDVLVAPKPFGQQLEATCKNTWFVEIWAGMFAVGFVFFYLYAYLSVYGTWTVEFSGRPTILNPNSPGYWKRPVRWNKEQTNLGNAPGNSVMTEDNLSVPDDFKVVRQPKVAAPEAAVPPTDPTPSPEASLEIKTLLQDTKLPSDLVKDVSKAADKDLHFQGLEMDYHPMDYFDYLCISTFLLLPAALYSAPHALWLGIEMRANEGTATFIGWSCMILKAVIDYLWFALAPVRFFLTRNSVTKNHMNDPVTGHSILQRAYDGRKRKFTTEVPNDGKIDFNNICATLLLETTLISAYTGKW